MISADPKAIADHIAMDNSVRALGFIVELRTKCLDLADYPRASPSSSVTPIWT